MQDESVEHIQSETAKSLIMMECLESRKSSDEKMESMDLEEDRRERARHSTERYRAKVREYEARSAAQFAETVRLLNLIYNAMGQSMELRSVELGREPKFESKISILEMNNGLLTKMLQMVTVQHYFPNDSCVGGGGKEELCSEEGCESFRCVWCGGWLKVTLSKSGVEEKMVSV